MSQSNNKFLAEGSTGRAEFDNYRLKNQVKDAPIQNRASTPPSPWLLQKHKEMMRLEQDKLEAINRERAAKKYGPLPDWME